MKSLVDKYAEKIVAAGLADNPLVCGMDDELIWNRQGMERRTLEAVVAGMNINSMICAEPAEPYGTILKFLAESNSGAIRPRDCETRTFLHDLPVTRTFSAEKIIRRLSRRKSVIVAESDTVRVVTFGTVSPEQAFVSFSSVCFACFVLFFSDYLTNLKQGRVTGLQRKAFENAVEFCHRRKTSPPKLMRGPFTSEARVYEAMIEAGRHTVEYGLVDSYFGNISCRLDDTIHISQTGCALDELAGCIDPCPMDGSSCVGITASSELSAHSEIFINTENLAILHGHPKFSVILSMDCDMDDCPNEGRCHVKCSQKRCIEDIPIVPGEVGVGPTGLCNTLPPAIIGNRGAIVWGHGLFTVSAVDFNDAFKHLLDIENMCRREYFERIGSS